MDISHVLGVVSVIMAVVIPIITYILAIGKMRWELDQYNRSKEKQWVRLDEHERAINTIHRTMDQTPVSVDKRLEKLESQYDAVKGMLFEISGEMKVLIQLAQASQRTLEDKGHVA